MREAKASVIVTGASRGLGAAAACWLGKAGCSVTLVARTADDLGQTAQAVVRAGGQATIVAADVADASRCEAAVERALNTYGRLDAIINNAGVLEPVARIADSAAARWQRNLAVNLLGPYYLTHAGLKSLRQVRGRIVNISSGAALNPVASWSAYCVAKAALAHFTRVLALEEQEITAVSLRPGVVDTAMQATIRAEGPKAMTTDKVAYFQRLKDEGQLEPPWRPARVAAWLALYAPHDLSGQLVNYDDPRVSVPAQTHFGEYRL